MPDFNLMQRVKRDLYAMRNGAIADRLRRLGSPHRIIFGLNLPQLAEIATRYAGDPALAEELWANTSTRESMLLAPMIYPIEGMTMETALRWIGTIPSAEVADILCHRLLRKLDFAPDLIDTLARSGRDIERYTALRLAFNLLPSRPDVSRALAETELSSGTPLTASICRALIDEVDFLME